MKTLPKIGAIGASIALAASTMLVGTAGAETVDISTPLIAPPSGLVLDAPGGEIALGAPEGSNFTGAYDDETGELTGEVTIANGSFQTEVADTPIGDVDVEIDFAFESGGPIEDGTIDDDGNVSFTDVQTLRLTNLDVPGVTEQGLGDSCAFGPLDLDYTGTYDEATNTVDVEAEFYVPLLQSGDCGELIGIDLAEAIMEALGNETLATSTLQFELGVSEIPEPEEPVEETTTTTTTPAPAPAEPALPAEPTGPAAPVAASPSYTG